MNKQIPLQNTPLTERIDKATNWLMDVVVFIPFVVSFGALKELAAHNGVNYAWLYPVMIDGTLIIFNLIALRSSLHGERNRYAWALVIATTAISVLLNIVHVPFGVLPMFMAALPPLFILAAFHAVVLRIEHSSKKNEAVTSLNELLMAIAEATAENEQLLTQNETAVQHHDTLTQETQRLQKEKYKLLTEIRHLEEEREALATPLDGKSLVVSQRHEQLLAIVNEPGRNFTQAELAEMLGASISTIRRDLQELNGAVSQ